MPMTDIVRYLNSRHQVLQPSEKPAPAGESPFVNADREVFVRYGNLNLRSRFAAVKETTTGQVHGHTAIMEANHLTSNILIESDAVFVLPTDDAEFIYLDRLVRTLHALNYLVQPVRGNLILRVHQRHVLSVQANHGLAFEEVLRSCGLLPAQITLEIDIEGIEEAVHLTHAIQNYRARGYRIAIHRFGRLTQNLELLTALKPNIVRLDSRLLRDTEALKVITDRVRVMGALSLASVAEGEFAKQAGLDLLQTV